MGVYEERIARCTDLMQEYDFDALILTKPANMYYLTGDGRLCAYAMITKEGEVAMGVPQTDIEDVKLSTRTDFVAGFDDEVGLIHSVAHFFKHFEIKQGTVGLEYAFLPQPRLGMFTHPHAKPNEIEPKDCTPLMSELRLIKEDEEIDKMKKAADVAAVGMRAALAKSGPGLRKMILPLRLIMPCDRLEQLTFIEVTWPLVCVPISLMGFQVFARLKKTT